MTETVVVIFLIVYLGMLLGRLPRLQLDRTGVALTGSIAVIAIGAMSIEEAVMSIDIPTMALLFAFMVISAQLRLGGFYTRTAETETGMDITPQKLLLAVILLTGVLSAVFMNDIVCLAIPPVLIHSCRNRRLDPVPFLLAVACASNIGSAATLIGNPQNILIGQSLDLSFSRYLLLAGAPSLIGLFITWAVIAYLYRGKWGLKDEGMEPRDEVLASWNPWQSTKALIITGCLFILFLTAPFPRDIMALGAAGILLLSRKMHSRHMLGLVDWQLLVLFCGLFVINHALQQTQLPEMVIEELLKYGIDLASPAWLFAITPVLSNMVSNVPAVMLLLPAASHPLAGPVLALSSTLSGNLLIIGSIANIIVVESAAAHGIKIDWRIHAPAGITITILTLAVAAGFLWIFMKAQCLS